MGQKLRKKLTGLGQKLANSRVDTKPGTVTVTYGVHNLTGLKLEKKSVSEVREKLKNALNIDPQSENLVNGKKVADDYKLQKNDVLEFVKKSGSKG